MKTKLLKKLEGYHAFLGNSTLTTNDFRALVRFCHELELLDVDTAQKYMATANRVDEREAVRGLTHTIADALGDGE